MAAKESLLELVKKTFIPEKEMERIKLAAKSDEHLSKVVLIYEALTNATLARPVGIMDGYLNFMKDSIEEATAHASNKDKIKITAGLEDGTDYYELPFCVAILTDKSNGLPERLAAINKVVSDSVKDFLELMNAHMYAKGVFTSNEPDKDIEDGLSYSDRKSMRNL